MPKKYKQKSLLTKPSSSAHSNLSLTSSSIPQNEPPRRTVNSLLHESRRIAGREAAMPVQQAASIPPSLRAVLDLPAPPPPTPRLGIRVPIRVRRIPGPPPPQSWLTNSIHTPAKLGNIPWNKGYQDFRIQKQSSILPGASFPLATSLQHTIIKKMATHWSWHVQYDHEYLAALPVKVKQIILSYLAIYSDDHEINLLRQLFPDTCKSEELREVVRLDLGNAIGGWSTLRKIERELEIVHPVASLNLLTIDNTTAIPDAWDVDEESQSSSVPPQISTDGLRFRNLRHLSLAIAPNTIGSIASWSGLISLTSKLSTIISLSLAYWPQPTYTPNASMGMTQITSAKPTPRQSVTYGGTNFYTSFDDDWREAAGILRSLSRFLYCLKWLDLTGCGSWLSALVWQPSDMDSNMTGSTGPDWNGSWRSLESLILAIGWHPGLPPQEPMQSLTRPHGANSSSEEDDDVRHISDLLSRSRSMQLDPRGSSDPNRPEPWNVEHERSKHYHRKEVEAYHEIQERAHLVAQQIQTIRKENGGRWLDISLSSKYEDSVSER